MVLACENKIYYNHKIMVSLFVYIGLVIIHAHEQNRSGMGFAVPLVPTIPAISILCNIQLMVHLNTLTWLRFMIWMALGK